MNKAKGLAQSLCHGTKYSTLACRCHYKDISYESLDDNDELIGHSRLPQSSGHTVNNDKCKRRT